MKNKTKSIDKDAVVRRLYARGTWKLRSVAHFGSGEVGIADMSFLRDENDVPFIPAASITGASRSFLTRQCLPWPQYSHEGGIKNESPELKRLFGGAEKEDTVEASDPMSALIIADAPCVDEKVNTSTRDGVRVLHESGTAAEGAKFDVEVIERGTEFELNLECIIRQVDDKPPGLKDGKKKPNLEELFLALLHAFEQGNIRLGARTRRGYGRGEVESWKIHDLKMCNPEDVMAWLRDDPWSRPESNLKPEPLHTDQQRYFRIEADFQLRTSLLIRSSSGDPEAPDMIHLQSDGEPVLPGTSFAGAFRHRATLIANTICWANDAVDKMFGYVYEDKGTNKQKTDAQASRVWIEEQLVKNVRYQWQDRVAIDRFTGGSLEGALFNEKPVYPLSLDEIAKKESSSNLRLILTLEEPEEAEIGLLLLTLRDFWSGHAALGGETSNGRGTLQGIKAKLIYKNTDDPNNTDEWQLTQNDNDKRMTVEDDEGFLQSCVKEAQGYSNCPTGSRRPKKEVRKENNHVE